MGSHMRRMEASEPPWLLNQFVKLMLSRALTLRMPPSGSNRALTTGDVPSARELAACRSRMPFRGVNNGTEQSCQDQIVKQWHLADSPHKMGEEQGARCIGTCRVEHWTGQTSS